MQEIIRLAFFYLGGIWRYRWFTLIIAAAICPIGWFYVANLPDQYSSSARVFVDTDSVLTDLLQGLAIQTDDSRRVSMMTRVLFSNENMEKLARMTDLDLRAKTPQQMEGLVGSLKRRVRLRHSGGNIYQISFSDTNPDLTKRVVQSMLTIFVESNLGKARQDQDSAEQFLQREIKDYERRIIEGERKLKDFKLRNLEFVTDKGNYYQRLRNAQDAHKKAQEELELAIKRSAQVGEQFKKVEAESEEVQEQRYRQSIEKAAKAVTAPHDERIRQVDAQIDELLLKYTEVHPEVIALQQTRERLKQRRAADRAEFLAMQDWEGAGDLTSNPLYRQMRLRVSESAEEIATQEARVQRFAEQIQSLQRTVDHVLQIEAEENQLNRDFGILKTNHNALITRLEKARLTRQVDTSADTVRFRTLDPPKVPRKPTGPNRVAFSSMVFGGALAAGLAVAFLISLLRPVFSDRRQLNEAAGIPVLGSINMIWTDRQKKRKHLGTLIFAVSFFGLIGSYGLVLAVFYLDIDVMSKLPI